MRREIGSNPQPDAGAGRHEKQQAAPFLSKCRQHEPEGYFAGKLIMDSGLRGYQVGGARSFREALRLCDQCRKCHRRRCMQADGRCTADCQRKVWRDTGAGSEVSWRILTEKFRPEIYVSGRNKNLSHQEIRYAICNSYRRFWRW